MLDAQKNRFIETVLLSTHNICFGLEIKKIVLQYTLLSGGLFIYQPKNMLGGIRKSRLGSEPKYCGYSVHFLYQHSSVLYW